MIDWLKTGAEALAQSEAADKVIERVGAASVASGMTSPLWLSDATWSSILTVATATGAIMLVIDRAVRVYINLREHRARMEGRDIGSTTND